MRWAERRGRIGGSLLPAGYPPVFRLRLPAGLAGCMVASASLKSVCACQPRAGDATLAGLKMTEEEVERHNALYAQAWQLVEGQLALLAQAASTRKRSPTFRERLR